jgi:hypothetical protein
LSTCTTGSEVGIAWLATLCVPCCLDHSCLSNRSTLIGVR